MRNELQLPQKIFSYVPVPVSAIIAFVSVVTMLDSSGRGNGLVAILCLLLIIVCLVFIFGKSSSDSKLKKLRLGLNPKYLTTKFPKNLEGQINELINQKFEVKEKTNTTARLEKRPELAILDCIVLFLLGVIPGIIYLAWYFSQPVEQVLLDTSNQ